MRPGKAKGPSTSLGSGGGGGGTFPPIAPVIVPAWFRAGTFTHTDFQIAALTNSLALYALPAKGVLHGLLLTPVEQFTGTGMTYYQVTCGLAGDLARYSAAFDVLNTPIAGDLVQFLPLFVFESSTLASALLITATADANLNLSTAGSFTLDLLVSITP